MKSPNYYRQQAEDCRLIAGLLVGLGVASVLAGAAVCWSCGAGLGLLACLVVAAVCAVGAFHELAQANGHELRARREAIYQRRKIP